jgi:serine/threonine protein kinase
LHDAACGTTLRALGVFVSPAPLETRDSPDQANVVCLVMPLLQVDLHQLSRSSSPVADGRPRGNQLLYIVASICLALATMHRCGIAHRDVKPSNVLVGSEWEVCLGDFGLTCSFSRRSSPTLLSEETFTGYVATRSYRAPEILFRTSPHDIPPPRCAYDPQAVDMWAVGCLIVEITTGRRLFDGTKGQQFQWRRMVALLGVPCATVVARYWETTLAEALLTHGGADDDPTALSDDGGRSIEELLVGSHDSDAKVAELADLVRGLLRFNPTERLTARGALAHAALRSTAVDIFGTSCLHEEAASHPRRFVDERDDVAHLAQELQGVSCELI